MVGRTMVETQEKEAKRHSIVSPRLRGGYHAQKTQRRRKQSWARARYHGQFEQVIKTQNVN
jgi:hypothetical protein